LVSLISRITSLEWIVAPSKLGNCADVGYHSMDYQRLTEGIGLYHS
jgi:hypothetical protein